MANKWSKKFPKRGCVGYYWFRSAIQDDPIIVEISGGARGVAQVVFLGDEMLQKDEFVKSNGEGEFYGPITAPE